jgi:transcriptional regulator NrdR family protein
MTRKCPSCGNRSKIIDTRETTTTVRRIRECIKCKSRWTTWEASINPSHAMASMRNAMLGVQTAARLVEDAVHRLKRSDVGPREDSEKEPCSPIRNAGSGATGPAT